jgi:hypothetical protein
VSSLIELDGQQWVVGLLWQTTTGRKAKASAKEVAKDLKDDLMCTRALPTANYGSSAIQFGLASSRDLGKKAKSIPSLAGALASIRTGSWIGAFALAPDSYFALIVKDDAILASGGDRLFGSEAELLQYVNGQLKLANWDFVVSSGVALDNSETVDLKAILASSRGKAPKLVLVSGMFKLDGDFPIVRVIQIAIIGAFAAVYFWPETKTQPVFVTQAKAPPPPPPWPTMQAPSAWTEGCAKVIDASPSAIGGWVFTSLACSGSTAMILMKRTKLGTYQDMVRVGGTLAQDNNTATLNRILDKAARPGNEPQRDMEIKYFLADAVETQGDTIDIRIVPPPLPGAESKQEPPNWTEMPFQIRTTNDVRSFAWLDKLPGVRLTKIVYTPAEKPLFKIEGVIYVKK